MTCKLCDGKLFVPSPTRGTPERCPCQSGKEIPCVQLMGFDLHQSPLEAALGVEPWCFVCDPSRKWRLSRGMMIVRTAWLPNGHHAHHDQKKRAAPTPPSRIVVCEDCVGMMFGFVQTRGAPLFRTVNPERLDNNNPDDDAPRIVLTEG